MAYLCFLYVGANSFSATPARATLSALVVSVVLNRALVREFISVKLSLYWSLLFLNKSQQ